MKRFGLGKEIKIVLSVLVHPRTFVATAKESIYAQKWLSPVCWGMAVRFGIKKIKRFVRVRQSSISLPNEVSQFVEIKNADKYEEFK